MARKGLAINGWIVIDKPAGLTSTQVVGRVRRLTGAAKLGHGGTLDPMATGVLPIALGEATKTVSYVMDGAKRYRFTLRWGEARDTDDIEGAVVAVSPVRPDEAAIRAALPRLTGEIAQVPPVYSAIKIGGRRAYDLARAKQEIVPESRPVRIDSFVLTELPDRDHATFEVFSGKGAYMRALARDLGRMLGTVACISALRRFAVGHFTENDAVSLEELGLGPEAVLATRLFPVETALDDVPSLAMTEIQASYLRQGRPVRLLDAARLAHTAERAVVLATLGGKAVALARYEAGEIHPVRVLNL